MKQILKNQHIFHPNKGTYPHYSLNSFCIISYIQLDIILRAHKQNVVFCLQRTLKLMSFRGLRPLDPHRGFALDPLGAYRRSHTLAFFGVQNQKSSTYATVILCKKTICNDIFPVTQMYFLVKSIKLSNITLCEI